MSKLRVQEIEIDGASNPWEIESASNENGSYTKFPDGTLICWAIRQINHTDSGTSASNRIASSWTFPHPFISRAMVTFQLPIHNNDRWINCSRRGVDQWGTSGDAAAGTHSQSLTVFFTTTVDSTSYIRGCHLMAVGRWK